jgi:hypothetical protein
MRRAPERSIRVYQKQERQFANLIVQPATRGSKEALKDRHGVLPLYVGEWQCRTNVPALPPAQLFKDMPGEACLRSVRFQLAVIPALVAAATAAAAAQIQIDIDIDIHVDTEQSTAASLYVGLRLHD